MLVITVTKHNANTGEVTEIGRMSVSNVGGGLSFADYKVVLDDGPDGSVGSVGKVETAKVYQHMRSLPVWDLVSKALQALGR